MLQWAAGGLLFTWVTTRRREVSLGYGWTMRIVFGALAGVGLVTGLAGTVARVGAGGLIAGAAAGLAVSFARRGAGVSGVTARREARRARVAAMLARGPGGDPAAAAPSGREFPPVLDLVAALAGFVGVLGAAATDGGPYALTAARFAAGALLLGAVSASMLLGHWYLVQPGLGRGPLRELVALTASVWPLHLALYLAPTGMVQVLDGTVDDGYGGLLGWVWLTCAVTTIGLVAVTWLALRERYYSAVMAATGLMYLAILTGFGMDLVARAVLAP